MLKYHSLSMPVIVGSLILAVSGCSDVPDPAVSPDFDPSDAGSRAMAAYDANNDGKIDAEELKKSPGLAAAVANGKIDIDEDGALSESEIVERVDQWLNADTIVNNGSVLVTIDGQRVEGVTVTFEPEAFLGEVVSTNTAVTDASGVAHLHAKECNYPNASIYLGFYRVIISKKSGDKETLPARYNTETDLGYESTPEAIGVGSIEFHLTTR